MAEQQPSEQDQSVEPRKLPKIAKPELVVIKEFVPLYPEVARSAGRLIVRSEIYTCTMQQLDTFYEILSLDTSVMDPPIDLDPEDVDVVKYSSGRFKDTFGAEVFIPAGHIVPDEYIRRSFLELAQ